MRKIAIYGTGNVADFFMKHHNFRDEKIVYFIETDVRHDSYKEYKVVSVHDVTNDIETIYIANTYADTIKNLIDNGVSKEKLVLCNKKLHRDYLYETNGVDDLAYDREVAGLYEDYIKNVQNRPRYVITETMNNPIKIFECDKIQKAFGQTYISTEDYCRYGTLRLIIEEIKNNQVQGELAELGVYRGDFAKCINAEFPDRKLYLFDTFEGFDNRDITEDIKNGYTSKEWFESWENFKYTNLELVMQKMNYKDQCVVCKGYFPDTIPEEEVNYALVSLDCDLYEPILAGLRYFYPRLNEGGYIMVHDYNQTSHLRGVKQAIRDYESETGNKMVKVPIPDVCGTLIISK